MKLRLKPLWSSLVGFGRTHSHEIFIALGIGGYLSATVLAVAATPNAMRDISAAEMDAEEPLTKMQIAKVACKHYIPAAVATASATVCVIAGTSKANKRIAALATFCQLAEENSDEFKAKVTELIGEKKVTAIEEQVAADKVKNVDISDEQIVQTKYGESIFWDPWSDRAFACNLDRINAAMASIRASLASDDSEPVRLNDFYDMIGLDHTQLGACGGWTNADQVYIRFGYGPSKDGRACTVLDYDIYLDGYTTKLCGTDRVLL